jgi:hypothetical protein
VRRARPEKGGLDILVCDGFSDPFWPERWAFEEKGGRRIVPGKNGIKGGEDIGMKDVLDAIVGIRKEFGAVVVLTTQFINVCFRLAMADSRQIP